jgi:hypothetical protein
MVQIGIKIFCEFKHCIGWCFLMCPRIGLGIIAVAHTKGNLVYHLPCIRTMHCPGNVNSVV